MTWTRTYALALSAVLLTLGCQNGGMNNAMNPDLGMVAGYPPPTKKVGMTWYKDVLPLVQNHCQGCHTTGGIAPFPLLTYDDGMRNAVAMQQATQARIMPPWMPAPDCQSFMNARVLTQDEVNTIYSWVDDNTPEGDPADAPPPPPPPMTLSWIDRTLDPGGSYTPNSAVTDDYHCFVLDPGLTSAATLVGYDFIAGVRSQVHHVLVYSGSLSEAQGLDAATPEIGYTCYGGPGISNPQLVAAWVPGSSATTFPVNTGVPLKSGSGLVMQIHYNLTNGPVQPDRSTLELQFAKQPVARPAAILPLAQQNFSIPPMSTGYSASATTTVSMPGTVWGIAPHMHTLGQQVTVMTTPPGGSSSCLIDIPAWNFHWQQLYFYDNPNGLPAVSGAAITLTCTWNNPGPTAITWGESTSDEMCITYFYVTQ